MKQIITILLVFLVSLPVFAQIDRETQPKFERFQKYQILKTLTKRNTNKNHPHYDLKSNREDFLKTSQEDKKTLDSIIYQEFDINMSQLMRYFKIEFAYDANENVKTMVLFQWDNSNWSLPITKIEYTYDSNGNLINETTFLFVGVDVWIENIKYEYIYENNILMMTAAFYSDGIQWVNDWKDEYTYVNGNMILEIGSYWDTFTSQWYEYAKYEYSYMDNNLTEEISYVCNTYPCQWVENEKWVFNYDGVLIQEILSEWNGMQWVNKEKYDYTRTFQLIIEVGSIWDTNTSMWVNDYRDEYSTDANLNLTVVIYKIWVTNLGEWVINFKDEYIYDYNYWRDDLIVPFELLFDLDEAELPFFNNMLIGYNGYEYVNDSYSDFDQMRFYYSNYNNSLNTEDEILAGSINIYPNPVSDVLTINSEIPLTNVEIFSVLGEKVKEMNSDFKSLSMDNLSTGIYHVRIRSENGVTNRKIVKK